MESDQENIQYPDLTAELAAMAEEDQQARRRREHVRSADQKNTHRMHEIVDKVGWPTISRVGKQGSFNAWLLVQHADHDVEFQKRCLGLMKQTQEGEVSKRNLAYLEDRVRVNTGQPQLYGTQFYIDENNVFGPRPIEDPEGLDKRRVAMDLEPFAEYRKIMEEGLNVYKPHLPKDKG